MLESSSVVAFVTVSDPDAARRFYGETLQLTPIEESAFALVFDAHGTTLRVAVSPGVEPAPYTVVGWTVTDIERTADDLAGRGVRLERFEGFELDERGLWTTPSGARVGWFKDPHGNVLSITESTASSAPRPPSLSWVELLTLIVEGPRPEPSVRGAIRSRPGSDQHHGAVGWYAYAGSPLPSFAGVVPTPDDESEAPSLRVWRDGVRVRIEEPDGRPNFIAGENTCWRFDHENDEPVSSPRSAAHFGINGTELLIRRELSEFAGDDFTRPAGPIGSTTFLGRAAWTVELAPPRHKPYPMQLVVDAETGLILQQRNDGFGSVDEWVEFVVGEPFDDALFTWDGASRTDADVRHALDAEHEADIARRRQWFEANVARLPLRLLLDVNAQVHEFNEATGAFVASIGHLGTLSRRPRSTEAWDDAEPSAHRWSDAQFDWALHIDRAEFKPDAIEALMRQLITPGTS